MSENDQIVRASDRRGDAGNRSPRRVPIWLIALLSLAILAILALNLLATQMDDSLLHQDYGIAFILSYGITFFVGLILVIWLFFFSRWHVLLAKVLPALIVLVVILGFVVYKPRFGGNVNIVGFEPRFWSNEVDIEVKREVANLSTRTPNDFPQLFGPDRTGVIKGYEWMDGQPDILWNRPVGRGASGFSAVNGYAVTMEQSDEAELVTCYRIADGSLVWTYRHEARYQDPTNLGGAGPRCTPTISGGQVFALGATGILVCLDGATGELLWRVDIPKHLGIERTEHSTMAGVAYQLEDNRLSWGRAASPLVYQDRVIAPGGGPSGGPYVSLIAFDRQTGNELWRGGEQMISYGSPSLVRLHGEDVVAIVNESSVAGHDPQTGRELWRHEREGRSDSNANCSQAIPAGDNRLLLGKGYGLGGELIYITLQNEVERIWKNQRVVKTKFTIPVIYERHIYSLSDGILECVELSSGKRVWKRQRFGQGHLLLVGDKLLIHSEEGTLHLVDATPEGYREHDDFEIETIGGICWNTLCVYGTQLLVRSDQEAALIQLPLQPQR